MVLLRVCADGLADALYYRIVYYRIVYYLVCEGIEQDELQ